MASYKPEEIIEITINHGVKKANYPFLKSLILGFQAGAFIALGYLLYIRVTAPLSGELEGLSTIIGASLFPIGLILTLMAGGELLTGNMMAVPLARYAKKIKTVALLRNLAVITLSNFFGALFVAYFFGHIVGLTESGVYLEKMIDIAEHKLDGSFVQAFVSGIGCNWLVALAVWLCYGSNTSSGKILGIWFPTMTFVAIGFQHVVANMFVIPAAIFAGYLNWFDYISNFIPVFLGNLVGGSIFVAMLYWFSLHHHHNNNERENQSLKAS
ncbi:formate/nitrite transporter family protein [Robertmurraya sp. DFI.2.37]|uniref:formate/nitrite transporter family protein n=1 Tax=Robertmurraya sp. DFI.2.37 TaxID=3031819 RepID=UPI001244FF0A|nr:formate/nitrite transporter family protein [Robertmurraya sp. DFI.2.37]MDF1509567.1 formate/nitrite transporter family protein [Robertmurraya sp. DFI.2.37]